MIFLVSYIGVRYNSIAFIVKKLWHFYSNYLNNVQGIILWIYFICIRFWIHFVYIFRSNLSPQPPAETERNKFLKISRMSIDVIFDFNRKRTKFTGTSGPWNEVPWLIIGFILGGLHNFYPWASWKILQKCSVHFIYPTTILRSNDIAIVFRPLFKKQLGFDGFLAQETQRSLPK